MDLRQLFPKGSKGFYKLNEKTFIALNSEVPGAESERNKAPALGGTVQRKTESVPRVTVRFTSYRVRPLDPDNLAGGCKDLLDGLRHAHIINGDEPWRINFQTSQEKVGSYWEEKTVIEIL